MQIPELTGADKLTLNLDIIVSIYFNRITFWDDSEVSSASCPFQASLCAIANLSCAAADREAQRWSSFAPPADPNHNANLVFPYVEPLHR